RGREARIRAEIAAHADEEDAKAVLRDAKGGGVHDAAGDAVLALKREVFKDLLAHKAAAEILKARHILHHEGPRHQHADHGDVMAIEAVARIIDEPRMVAYLGEALTGRPADHGVQLALSYGIKEALLNGGLGNIAQNEFGAVLAVIKLVRRASPRIDVCRR